MHPRITIRLATVPIFARERHHPAQVEFYSKFTEFTFKALNLPSVIEFMNQLAEELNLEAIEVRVLRMPDTGRTASLIHKEGKPHLIVEYRQGSFSRRRDLIDIYPPLLWPSRKTKPTELVGIRGFILNTSIRTLIHEMLHKSGVKDETRVRKLTDQHYKNFRHICLTRFETEFKPTLNEWKKTEKNMGLR